jgi:hypothetical protein
MFVNNFMNNSSSFSQERLARRQPKQKRGKERLEKILMAAAEVYFLWLLKVIVLNIVKLFLPS